MTFPSIRIEGAILSGELLSRLDSADYRGQKAADFGFDSPSRLKEEIVRAWTDAHAFWKAFQRRVETLKEGATGATETRNQWVIPLLGLLGYSELEYQQQAELIGDKPFRISHRLRSHGGFPVHIVGVRESLDRKPEGGTGPRVSPHAHAQEYLNLKGVLFALVTNGRLLRLLRDSTRLVKLSYVEFDLDRIFSEELFADFAVLYRLLHVSRLPKSPEHAAESLLERYHQDALESGARIRDGLRVAVEQAIRELGTGFLARTPALQEAVAAGTLAPRDFYHGLLRLIYRLLFLMTAEERGLLFPRDAEGMCPNTLDHAINVSKCVKPPPGSSLETAMNLGEILAEADDLERLKKEHEKQLADLKTEQARLNKRVIATHTAYEIEKNRIAAETTEQREWQRQLNGTSILFEAAEESESSAGIQRKALEDAAKLRDGIKDTVEELRRDHVANEQKFSDAFADAVRAAMGGKVEPSISLTDRGFTLSVKRKGELSGAALETIKVLAFDLAAMVLSVEGVGYHPRFLIHDGPREADMARLIYERFFLYARKLEQSFDDSNDASFQYIITTTTPPPKDMQREDEWLRMTLNTMQTNERFLREDL